MRRGMEVMSLWHCSGVMEAKVTLISAFRSSALLDLVSLIFLLTIPHRFSMGFRSSEFAGQSSTPTPWPLNQLLVPLAVWAGPAGKLNQLLQKACQQKEAWSALKCPVLTLDFRKHSGPTPADNMAAQIMTDWKLHTGLQATWILCFIGWMFCTLNKQTKLQMVQNAAARVFTRTRKYDHISPVLSTLHWLPIKHRIDFKMLLITFKALKGLAP